MTYTMFLACRKCNHILCLGELLKRPTVVRSTPEPYDLEDFLREHWPHADDKANAFEVKIEKVEDTPPSPTVEPFDCNTPRCSTWDYEVWLKGGR